MTSIKISISLATILVAVVSAKKPNPLPSIPANSSVLNRVRPIPSVSTTTIVLPTRLPTSSTPTVPVSSPSTSASPSLSVPEIQSIPAQSAPAVSIQAPPQPSGDQVQQVVITAEQATLLDRFMGPYKHSK